MAFKYLMMQLPSEFVVSRVGESDELAAKLEETVNSQANLGWEFYRMDQFTVLEHPGCLGSIFGAKTVARTEYIVSFRKPA